MGWIALSYTVSSKSTSSPRVKIWRRLQRLGAITPVGGLHILPGSSECVEAFQWLSQEIQQAGGQAMVMQVEKFQGFSDQALIECFRQARNEDYEEIEMKAIALKDKIEPGIDAKTELEIKEGLAKLQRQYNDVAEIDYFESPSGKRLARVLADLFRSLAPEENEHLKVEPASIENYRSKRWVTRPRPHVDRLASIWLIRRFIDGDAEIRYSSEPQTDEVSFDMESAQFGHVGNLCTFEAMLRAFDLNSPELTQLAELVHAIDLRDERFFHLEISGVDAVLRGWQSLNLSDAELEERGLALFDSLFAHFSAKLGQLSNEEIEEQ